MNIECKTWRTDYRYVPFFCAVKLCFTCVEKKKKKILNARDFLFSAYVVYVQCGMCILTIHSRSGSPKLNRMFFCALSASPLKSPVTSEKSHFIMHNKCDFLYT